MPRISRGMLFRVRDLLVRHQRARGHLAEFARGVRRMSARWRVRLRTRMRTCPRRVRRGVAGSDRGARCEVAELDASGRSGGRKSPRWRSGLRAAAPRVPPRARLLGLARPCAAPAHNGRQAAAGQDIQDGPARPEAAAGGRRHVGDPERHAGCWRGSRGSLSAPRASPGDDQTAEPGLVPGVGRVEGPRLFRGAEEHATPIWTRSAHSIQASGTDHAAQTGRIDDSTRPHTPRRPKKPLHHWGRDGTRPG